MAVLTRIPELAIIKGFKGTLDFYVWKGIPCCRKWPTYSPYTPHPSELANQTDFAYINKLWGTVTRAVQNAYREMARPTVYTGKDLFVMAYMKGIDYGVP